MQEQVAGTEGITCQRFQVHDLLRGYVIKSTQETTILLLRRKFSRRFVHKGVGGILNL